MGNLIVAAIFGEERNFGVLTTSPASPLIYECKDEFKLHLSGPSYPLHTYTTRRISSLQRERAWLETDPGS